MMLGGQRAGRCCMLWEEIEMKASKDVWHSTTRPRIRMDHARPSPMPAKQRMAEARPIIRPNGKAWG